MILTMLVAHTEIRLVFTYILLYCFAVLGINSASDEDIAVIKSDVRALKAEMKAEMEDVKKDLQRLQRQMDSVLNHIVSSSLLYISTRPADNNPLPRDCTDVMSHGEKTSGVYTVYVGIMKRPVQVYCDMTTDGGGWTVFQRRQDGRLNFYHNWADYEKGFGNVNDEHWLGNDILHRMTYDRMYRLRVDLADWNGNTRYAEYSNFKVASACEKYELTLGAYCGNAGDSLSGHSGQKFSTFDQDNDYSTASCAQVCKGGWWYNKCHISNINGLYLKGTTASYADGINWYHWTGYYYSLKFTEMKIRLAEM